MADPAYCACEFVLIRVAPDPIRNEAINIGVALFQPQGPFAGVRINADFRRAHCLAPQFQEADLQGLEQELLAKLQPGGTAAREYFLQLAQETFSHALQISPPTLVLTEDPARELELLYERYAASPEAPRTVAVGPRRAVLRHLERVFAEERVLDRLQRNLRAGEWLGEPDAFRFDFHYQPNGLRHVLQALPLDGAEAGVKELCFTVQRLRARLGAIDAASFSAAPLSEVPAAYHRELLMQAGVRVLGLEQAPQEAARIRAALGMA